MALPHLVPALVLSGPTAVGKTAALEALAAWAPVPLEVVSVDAYQVYRGLDIGTAKPSRDLLLRFPHHLIDIRDPREGYGLGEFLEDAQATLADIRSRGAWPVFCGGTVYYLKHLLEGRPEAPPADPAVRAALAAEAADGGMGALREELARVDPASAGRIHPNDSYRILRALEVWRSSGRPLSSFARTGGAALLEGAAVVALERPREELRERIAARVAEMFAAGLPDEVAGLRAAGLDPSAPGMMAIGYREFFAESPSGGWAPRDDLDAVRGDIVLHSAQYAKRQTTFLGAVGGAIRVPAGDGAALRAAVKRSCGF